VKVLSPLFGFLGKATAARSNTSEEGDTKLTMPGVISNVLSAPFPIYKVSNVPNVNALTEPQISSFFWSEQAQFNANTTVDLFSLGPGVWSIMVDMALEEQGAVSDATSIHRLVLYPNDGILQSIDLGRLTNKQGLNQSHQINWVHTITTEASWVFRRINSAGAGLGINRYNDIIICSKLF